VKRWALAIGAAVLLLAMPALGVRYLYEWSGPTFTTAVGTVSLADSVSGYLVIEGPIENLNGAVTPVEFAFTAGPVTIDDGTPLHPLTQIELETDGNGEITDAVIQLVQEIDTGAGTTYADVICVWACPAGGPGVDLVLDRDGRAVEIGSGEVALVESHWSTPLEVGSPVQAVSVLGRLVLAGALAAGGIGGSIFRRRRAERGQGQVRGR